jgi:hypothetical protein
MGLAQNPTPIFAKYGLGFSNQKTIKSKSQKTLKGKNKINQKWLGARLGANI